MHDNEILNHAMGKFFDLPVSYNPFVAKALSSTKAAILLDFLIEKESKVDNERRLTHADIAHQTGLGLTEVKTALSILEGADVISRTKESTNISTYSVSSYFMADLFARLEQLKAIDGHLMLDMMSTIAINRLHLCTIKDLGGNVNGSILLSFMLSKMSANDRRARGDKTEWVEVNDSLWQGMTGMSEKELRNAKKSLIELGYLERSKQGMPAKVCFRLNMKFLADSTWAFAQKTQPRKSPVKKPSYQKNTHARAYA